MLQGLQLLHSDLIVQWKELFLAMFISGVTGYLCIYLFLKMLAKIGIYPFVIYRIILGAFLLKVFL